MKLLVTGGGGYLGTTLIRALIDARYGYPHPIHVLDRFDHGTQPLLSAVARSHKQVKVFLGNVTDPEHVHEAAQGCDAIIHLAGIVGYPACDADPEEADWTNVTGTRVVCAMAAGRPIYFASTGSTYGKVEGLALESQPISPLTRYGRNKAEAEGIVREAGGVSFRLATLYGTSDRMRWDLLPHSFAREAVRSGHLHIYEGGARRTFLHVRDAAEAFVAALDQGLPPGELYNVGRATGNYTKAQVALEVQAVTGCAVRAAEGTDPDQRDYTVGFAKIQAALPRWGYGLERVGYRLEHTLPEIVRWARGWR